jgi:hypothetical protein
MEINTIYPDIEEDIGFKRPCTSNIGGTVKPYQVHILYLKEQAPLWPKQINSYQDFKEIKNYLKQQNIGVKIKYSLCERTDIMVNNDSIELLCFQQGSGSQFSMTQISLTLAMLPDLSSYLKTGDKGKLTVTKLPEDLYILVCAHRAKDARCGHCGPIIADEFTKQLMSLHNKYAVFKISHVGKHEYAANVITYPSGDWYGYVKPTDVTRIIKHINSNTKSYRELGDIWRGSMHLSTEEQISLSPKAFINIKSSRKIVNKERTINWNDYGFGPVGEEALNGYLWILFWILALWVLYTFNFNLSGEQVTQ